MAGARGRSRKSTDQSSPRRSKRGAAASQDDGDVPIVFQDMLQEEQADHATGADDDERPLKKRRTARSSNLSQTQIEDSMPEPKKTFATTHSGYQADLSDTVHSVTASQPPARVLQTVYDSDESEDSDEEWEDALVTGEDSDEPGVDALPEIGNISIAIGDKKDEQKLAKRRVRRRAITAVDKKKRLDIHKMHIVCLLYHVHRRNFWCNDLRVQTILRKLVPSKILTALIPNPNITQYSASKLFIEGMNDLSSVWSRRFKPTAYGMSKPKWAEADADVRPSSDFDELDDPMDKDDFRNAAHTLQGSQDVGTQLFCALLRGIGIEARLICSLQPLPFASSAQLSTPQKSGIQKNAIHIDPYNRYPSRPQAHSAPRPKKLSRLERVMGERHSVLHNAGVAPKKQKAYHSSYPVYWVEVFNVAHQKWVPIDTHSTFTVNSPEKLEPPLNSTQNSLTYAIAFEEDYSARDVTKRYAKAFNAKTRKFRVECTPHGVGWWTQTMKHFRRSIGLDRDQIEDMTLAKKEAAEGMPRNVQDFKDHPVYVMERHLKHNEVIHPLHQVGKVNTGSSFNPKMEPIYRRKDVHLVRSADKWYRMGREVKGGEQPLKHAKPRKRRQPSNGPDIDMEQEEEEVGAGLYAEFQTELYVPPPVVRGRVPRNTYGNLDLYVSSMCPPGGIHVRHKLASKAARIVGVDFAEAVTGFKFKGRHGTAIVQGVVVASEYAEAVQAAIEGLEYQVEAAAEQAKTQESLRLWRRFSVGLRISYRLGISQLDEVADADINLQDAIDQEDKKMAELEMAGGFFPDEADFAQPTRNEQNAATQDSDDEGFIVDDEPSNDGGGGFIADEDEDDDEDAPPRNRFKIAREHSFESSILDSQQMRPRRRSNFGDDYILEESDDDQAGGFLHESPEAGASADKEDESTTDPDTNASADAAADLSTDPATTIEASPNDARMLMNDGTTDVYASVQPQDTALAVEAAKEQTTPSPSSMSDTGSLPLEDPDDEDADPDWLVDAT